MANMNKKFIARNLNEVKLFELLDVVLRRRLALTWVDLGIVEQRLAFFNMEFKKKRSKILSLFKFK